ncbi:MAG: PAS domain S-box protein [Deltaproteobacteria bacterium]|uniref:PAS domain S-box protein n=1 Tax=Candidatus Zymogenus saltonus TaxID=2844893 RepID=A0A9D8KDZ8_9DELT|nr:PAS domain S-box protein [Candidatus Zymogenus saltonus]
MAKEIISILIIEDDFGYVKIIKEMIDEAGGGDFTLKHSDTLTKGLDVLSKESFDVILLDMTLPDSEGLNTLLEVKDSVPDVPIVVLTSLENEKVALSAVRESAQDYLYKGEIKPSLLIRALRYAVERKRMLEDLKHAYDSLDIMVQERTEELSMANIQLQSEIQEKERAEDALRDNEELLKATIESTADGIFVINENGEVTHTNARFAELWNIPEKILRTKDDEELLKYFLDQLVEPKVFLSKVKGLYGAKEESRDILKFKDGRIFERYTCPLIRNGRFSGRVWSFRDITESKTAEEKIRSSEKRFKNIAERSFDVIFEMDLDGTITYVSPAAKRITGFELSEIIGQSFKRLMTESEAKRAQKILSRVWKGKDVEGYEFEVLKKDGSVATIEINSSPIFKDNEIIGNHGVARDISYRKEMKDEFDSLAMVDSLTGLLNQTQFHKNLKHEVKRAKRMSYPLSLIIFSFDDYDRYVEKNGPLKGDTIVREIGSIVKHSVREDVDSSYRLRQSEFSTILPCTTEEQGLMVAERVIVKIAKRIKNIRVAFGTASIEGHRSTEDIINAAEKDLIANRNSS